VKIEASGGSQGASPVFAARMPWTLPGTECERRWKMEPAQPTPTTPPSACWGVNNTLGTAPLNIADTLNATGNRTARAESFAGAARREAYGYDAIDQLIETRLNPVGTADQRRVAYSYDAAGNRTRVVEDADGTGPGTAQDRVYSAHALNQYTSMSGFAAPVYDIDGNTTRLQSGPRGWSYPYDAQNRLVSGTDGATTFQFHYDARNRCVSRVINGEVRYLTYDGWSLLEERENTGRLSAKHVHGGAVDEVLATVTPGGTRYLHEDGLGNVVALTGLTGAVLERVRYDAYGQPEHLTAAGAVSGVSPTGNRFLFTGREWFPELGLQDNRHRYYHPGVGRWLSRDPIGERGGLNLYGYVLNNPIHLFDPQGLSACDDFVDSLISDWEKQPRWDPTLDLGVTFLSKRSTTLKDVSGFKDELVAGGQGGAVSRHIYGHAGAPLAGGWWGVGASYYQQLVDHLQQFQAGRTAAEAAAEIAGDRAGRQVADALSRAYGDERKCKSQKDKDDAKDALRDVLKKILCK
jgi:RHS repeat-associated protein